MKSFLEYLLESKDTDTSIIQHILNDKKYDFDVISDNGSKTTYKVLVDKQFESTNKRNEIAKYLADKYDGTLITNNAGKTIVKFDQYGIKVRIKPKLKQGNQSAGVASEYAIVNLINSKIQENDNQPITLVFKSLDKKGTAEFICKDIIIAEQCGKEGSIKTKRIKADIRLKSTKTTYNISLKKAKAVWIENGSVYGHEWYVPTIKNAIAEKKTKLIKISPENYKLTKTIYWEMTQQEKENGLFGDDILPNGSVIEATFDDNTSLIQIDANTYQIDVNYIITSIKDAVGKHDLAWFAVPHEGRPGHWRGVYVRAAFMTRATSNTVKVDRIDK